MMDRLEARKINQPESTEVSNRASHLGVGGFPGRGTEEDSTFTLFDLEAPRRLPSVVHSLSELNRPTVDWLQQGGFNAPTPAAVEVPDEVADKILRELLSK